MKIETSPIMNSLIQFFIFVFKAIFYHNMQIQKKQLEYLFYTDVRRVSILGWGWGRTLVLTGLLGRGGGA